MRLKTTVALFASLAAVSATTMQRSKEGERVPQKRVAISSPAKPDEKRALPAHIQALKDQTVYVQSRTRDFNGDLHGNATGLIVRVVGEYTYILTANHIFEAGDLLGLEMDAYVDEDAFSFLEERPRAEVLKRGWDEDLMLLKAKGVSGKPIHLGEAELDEEVIQVGYSFDNFSVFHGRIAALYGALPHEDIHGDPAKYFMSTMKQHWIDINSPQGASGSGLWNNRGEVVGVLTSLHFVRGSRVMFAVTTKTITEFLEGTEADITGGQP